MVCCEMACMQRIWIRQTQLALLFAPSWLLQTALTLISDGVCMIEHKPANYRNGRRLANMEPYPVGGDGVVRPLELLRTAKPTHVVSVGRLRNPCRVVLIENGGSDPTMLVFGLYYTQHHAQTLASLRAHPATPRW